MNLSRCEKGHFFDKEKFATCPHCAQGVQADDSLTTVFTEELNTGINPTQPLTETGQEMQMPEMVQTPPVDTNQMPTMPLSQAVGATLPNTGGFGGFGGGFAIPEGMGVTQPTDDDNDHTVAFYDGFFTPQAAPEATMAVTNNVPKVSKPCVGWLVVTKGMHTGQDFRLKAGKNFIGRDAQMDIALTGDKSVSRNRHAVVVFEPKQHMYLVQPGESSELVYLNNNVVLSPTKLSAYDVITVGEVNLLFMPLCGDKFDWTKEFTKDE